MITFSHHAYVVVGDRETSRQVVRDSAAKFLGRSVEGFVDYREYLHDSYLVDDARLLRAEQLRTAVCGGAKFIAIIAGSINPNAQNALLKTLEEPTDQTFIFLILPSINNLLPTVLSRVEVVYVANSNADLITLAETFLDSKIPERFEMIEQVIGKEHPDRARARQFVGVLSQVFRKKYQPEIWTTEQKFAAAELIKAEDFLGDPASLAKMILEHLALILPVSKL